MQEKERENYLRVGVISNTHGVHGEVKVFPTTDDVKRFKKLKEAFLDTPDGLLLVHPVEARFFKNLVILKLREFTDMDEAQKHKGQDLLVHRDHAVALAENEYFICDIIGATVKTDEGEVLGELTEVMTTGANDVYSVKLANGNEVLLPVIPECVLSIDIQKKEVLVHMMKGLMDANTKA